MLTALVAVLVVVQVVGLLRHWADRPLLLPPIPVQVTVQATPTHGPGGPVQSARKP